MRLLAAAFLVLAPFSASAAASPPQRAAQMPEPKPCDRFAPVRHADSQIGTPPAVQRLDRLPPGDLHLTVERRVDGCRVPTIVRYGR